MNCRTAQKVWGHQDGFLAGLKQTCPGVLERLDETVKGLIDHTVNPFFASVKKKVGTVSRQYYVSHADDDDPLSELVHSVVGDTAAKGELEAYFSKKYGQPIVLGNLCCGGCEASVGKLSHEENLLIQHAAVRTAIDGSDIVI